MSEPTRADLLASLQAANALCRSAHEIAAREGRRTDWRAFRARLSAQLEGQQGLLAAPAGEAGFAGLVAVMAEWFVAAHPAPAAPEEGLAEVAEAMAMLELNLEEGDGPEAMLQNLSSLIGAAQRMAAVVLQDVPPERLAAITQDYAP